MTTEQNRERELLAALKAVTEEASLESTLRELLSRALEGVHGRLGWVAVAEAEGLRVLAVQGVETPSQGELLPFGRGLTGRAYRDARPLYVPDVSGEKDYWEVAPEVRSELVLPLVWSGERVGVLNVESTDLDGLDAGGRDFLETLAGLAAGVVARSLHEFTVRADLHRKKADLSLRLGEIQALISAARALSSSLDLHDITRTVLERAAQITGADFCHLLLEDEQSGALLMHTTTDLPGGLAEGSAVDISRGVTGWVAVNRQPLLVGDVQEDTRYVPWRAETASELAVPLMDGNRLLGVLNLESSRSHAFDTNHLEIASALAGLISAAAVNARLYAGLAKAKEGLSLTEGLRAAGEAAADVVHWVANKVGGMPDALRILKAEAPHVPPERRQTFLRLIQSMEDAAHEILNVKRAVMDAARPLKPQRVELAALVGDLVTRHFTPGSGITTSGSPAAAVLADTHALTRMLDNALHNAIRHSGGRPGDPVSVHWDEQDDRVVIQITDSGPGFPEDVLRLGALPRPGSGGTGMGLWLSSRLASRMDGSLELSNRPQGGAKVTISLPRADKP